MLPDAATPARTASNGVLRRWPPPQRQPQPGQRLGDQRGDMLLRFSSRTRFRPISVAALMASARI